MSMLACELNDPRTVLYPLTAAKYQSMIQRGIIDEGAPFELLNGLIVHKDRSARGEDPMTVGNEHIYTVGVLQEMAARLQKKGCHLRIQQPISIPPVNEPEPDGAIVIGKLQDYADRLPQAKDILSVIEVADASLRRDRTTKMEIYARGGMPVYFLINLVDRVVERYADPVRRSGQYGSPRIFSIDEKFSWPTATGKGLEVSVRHLMPPVPSIPARRKRSAS